MWSGVTAMMWSGVSGGVQWYFTTLYAVFKPLVEKRTRDKIQVLGGDYQAALQAHIAPEHIPEQYGGTLRDVPWVSQPSQAEGVRVRACVRHSQSALLTPAHNLTSLQSVSRFSFGDYSCLPLSGSLALGRPLPRAHRHL
mgnify:CR=1 FL=1